MARNKHIHFMKNTSYLLVMNLLSRWIQHCEFSFRSALIHYESVQVHSFRSRRWRRLYYELISSFGNFCEKQTKSKPNIGKLIEIICCCILFSRFTFTLYFPVIYILRFFRQLSQPCYRIYFSKSCLYEIICKL